MLPGIPGVSRIWAYVASRTESCEITRFGDVVCSQGDADPVAIFIGCVAGLVVGAVVAIPAQVGADVLEALARSRQA